MIIGLNYSTSKIRFLYIRTCTGSSTPLSPEKMEGVGNPENVFFGGGGGGLHQFMLDCNQQKLTTGLNATADEDRLEYQ